ncbi:enoyl-CoA hydratase/isomerase family protein [Pseudomonas sp. NPDC089569]|uniref:enoyl-CoA hydratase/isomerase family protein n=1 Tax=Pseudomonas sp. NPDC089569 TaxID=3390722 RepID=UPI003CFFFA68
MDYQSILYSREGAVAVITLNEPHTLNALSPVLGAEIRDALARVSNDKTVRALVLTANGRLFSSGADLSQSSISSSDGSRGQVVAEGMRSRGNRMIAEMQQLPVPVVVALNGPVVGGAVGLALSGDLIVAARSAYFYLPFTPKLGLVPDLGASWFLQRRIGSSRALALTLMDERLSAEKAAQWGLIHACVDDASLQDEAMRLAQKLARLPAHGVIEARAAFAAAQRNDLHEQLEYEAQRQSELLDLPTMDEGLTAFFEKREPAFPGRE